MLQLEISKDNWNVWWSIIYILYKGAVELQSHLMIAGMQTKACAFPVSKLTDQATA